MGFESDDSPSLIRLIARPFGDRGAHLAPFFADLTALRHVEVAFLRAQPWNGFLPTDANTSWVSSPSILD